MATTPLLDGEALTKALQEQFRSAHSFRIAMALLNEGGLNHIADAMKRALRRGATGQILVGLDLPSSPDGIQGLLDLRADFPEQLAVHYFDSPRRRCLHAKLFLFDHAKKRTAILGSANLTEGGLANNYEASVLIDEPASVDHLRNYFGELHDGAYARPVTEDWLALYRATWDARRRNRNEFARLRLQVPGRRQRGLPRNARIKGQLFVFTGRIVPWPRERKLYPTIRKLGGIIGEQRANWHSAILVQAELMGGRETTRKLEAARRWGSRTNKIEGERRGWARADVSGGHSGGNHADSRRSSGPGLLSNDDLDVLVECGQQVHQAFDREARKLVVAQRRDLWLRQSQHLGRLCLDELPCVEQLVQGICQAQFRLTFHGVREPEIGEHVPGAAGDRFLWFSASVCHSAPRGPSVPS